MKCSECGERIMAGHILCGKCWQDTHPSLPTHIQIRYDPNADILFVTAESPTTVITTNKKGGLNYEKISQ